MQKEIWKDVVGYEGLYQVSNLGRVKSLKRKVNCGYGSIRFIRARYLTPSMGNRGYYRVNLPVVSSWVLCAERQPDEEGMYSVKNKYELTGEYHKYGNWAGKWTTDDKDGYEYEIYVSEWKVI